MQKHYVQEQRLRLWLAISLIPDFAAGRFGKLLARSQCTPEQWQTASVSQLQAWGLTSEQARALIYPDERQIDACLAWLVNDNSHFILPLDDPAYPAQLQQISNPPLLLFGRGNQACLSERQMAMVGSRHPTPGAKQNAKQLAFELSQSGWVVTSGLALGIDACAHQGAIANQGVSVAVLGTGVDVIYPKRHQSLLVELLEQKGCVLSEFLPGTPAHSSNFPRRNRIVSGLSQGVVIVEAAIKSGSLITARYALEQNREVFAMPGNIQNPMVAGCHYLIQQGAKLVTGVADVNDEFLHLNFSLPLQSAQNGKKNASGHLASDRLLDSVDYEVTPVDLIAERSGLPVNQLLALLLEYELRGLLTAVDGGYIKLGEK